MFFSFFFSFSLSFFPPFFLLFSLYKWFLYSNNKVNCGFILGGGWAGLGWLFLYNIYPLTYIGRLLFFIFYSLWYFPDIALCAHLARDNRMRKKCLQIIALLRRVTGAEPVKVIIPVTQTAPTLQLGGQNASSQNSASSTLIAEFYWSIACRTIWLFLISTMIYSKTVGPAYYTKKGGVLYAVLLRQCSGVFKISCIYLNPGIKPLLFKYIKYKNELSHVNA